MSIHKLGQPLPLTSPSDAAGGSLNKKELTRLREASELYEKHFLGEMVKAMRKTVQHSPLTKPSMAQKIYLQKLDQQYVEAWGDSGGIGLSDLIYEQLKGRIEGLQHSGFEKPKGPLPISPPSGALPLRQQMEFFEVQQKGVDVGFLMRPQTSAFGGKVAVTVPWDGTVQRAVKNEEGQQAIWIEHSNGLNSVLSFKGRSLDLKAGEVVAGGKVMGELAAEGPELWWKVTKNVSAKA